MNFLDLLAEKTRLFEIIFFDEITSSLITKYLIGSIKN